MRLLNVNTLEFGEFGEDERPRYAIASHRWEKEEATFKEVQRRLHTSKKGYKKIEAFAKYVSESVHSVEWLWIDTCCINKDSAAELSEAINLMFKWYRNAELCLAYLADVDTIDDTTRFKQSEWFKRGWTLQELLAPRTVVFLTKSWKVIGNKGASSHGYNGTLIGPGLETDISVATGLPKQILHEYESSLSLPPSERLKWMEGRRTSREEDMSYALCGIFSVSLGANYGEGGISARNRLLAAIRQPDDQAMQRAAQFRKLANWLSPPDPWTNHNTARQRHVGQTGTWLLKSDQYQGWKTGSLRHLWVYGKAGCGKTVLCSTAIEDIRVRCDNKTNVGYAVFYFSFSDNRKQSFEDLLLSLVVQLGWKEPGLSMLQRAYETPNRSLPALDNLEKILFTCLKSYDELFLFTDALDECPEVDDARQRMLAFLAVISREAPSVRIFATSRELADVRKSMEALGAALLSIATHSVDADIQKYVSTQLSINHRMSRLDPTTKTIIEETISTKADGM